MGGPLLAPIEPGGFPFLARAHRGLVHRRSAGVFKAELGGFGRVLFQAREYWPDYISCVLVVRDDVIEKRPRAVQVLVDGRN
jgi:hypothetical protein